METDSLLEAAPRGHWRNCRFWCIRRLLRRGYPAEAIQVSGFSFLFLSRVEEMPSQVYRPHKLLFLVIIHLLLPSSAPFLASFSL